MTLRKSTTANGQDSDPPPSPTELRDLSITGWFAAVHPEHQKAYKWLRGHLSIEKFIECEPHPLIAENGVIRAAAGATADFLELTATTTKVHVERLRRSQAAIKHVLELPRLSDSTREELSLRLKQLRWLGAIGTKGNLREQVFLYQLFECSSLATTVDTSAAVFTPLLVALTGSDEDTAARTIRRYFAAFERYLAAC